MEKETESLLEKTVLNKELYQAVEEGDLGQVEALLRRGADPNQSQLWNGYSIDCALHVASMAGDMDIIRALLTANCNINLVNGCCQTALHIAAQNERIDVIEELLKADAATDVKDDLERTPLILGCKNSMVTELLVRAGCDVNMRDKFGFSALLDAAATGNVDSAAKLIGAGANVNQSDVEGYTPLMMAAKWGNAHMVKFLLSSHACAIARASNGATALYEAATMDCKETPTIMQSLLDAGCDPELGNAFSQTPLGCAIELSRVNNVKILLAANCAVNYTFPMFARDFTPLQLSFLQCHELVKQSGRDMKMTSIEKKELECHLCIMRMLTIAGSSVSDAVIGFEQALDKINQCAKLNLKSENRNAIPFITSFSKEIRSLMDLCRLRIRCHCGRQLTGSVRTWPIPVFLQDYVLLSEIQSI